MAFFRLLSVVSASVVLALLVFGCSFEYGSATDGSAEVPAIVVTNTRLVRVENGTKTVRVSAGTLEMYLDSKSWYGENVNFEGFDSNGHLTAEGTIPLLYVNIPKDEYIMTGGVSLEFSEDDLQINSGSLFWNGKTSLLSGDVSDRVTVSKTDGTKLSGVGFQADGLSKAFSFSRSINGTIVSSESPKTDETGSKNDGNIDNANVTEEPVSDFVSLDGETMSTERVE